MELQINILSNCFSSKRNQATFPITFLSLAEEVIKKLAMQWSCGAHPLEATTKFKINLNSFFSCISLPYNSWHLGTTELSCGIKFAHSMKSYYSEMFFVLWNGRLFHQGLIMLPMAFMLSSDAFSLRGIILAGCQSATLQTTFTENLSYSRSLFLFQ